MDFEQALVYELEIVNGLAGKVFPQNADEDVKPPMVVYVSSEGEPVMTLDGATDMTELTCEIHVICETYEQLKVMTKSVLDRVKSFFQRPIGQGAMTIRSITHSEPVESMDENLNYHSCSFDIRVRF